MVLDFLIARHQKHDKLIFTHIDGSSSQTPEDILYRNDWAKADVFRFATLVLYQVWLPPKFIHIPISSTSSLQMWPPLRPPERVLQSSETRPIPRSRDSRNPAGDAPRYRHPGRAAGRRRRYEGKSRLSVRTRQPRPAAASRHHITDESYLNRPTGSQSFGFFRTYGRLHPAWMR